MVISKVVETKIRTKEKISGLLKVINSFVDKVNSNRLSIYASCTAFYIFLSFIPMLIIAISLVPYLPITQENLTEAIINLVPAEIEGVVDSLIVDLYCNNIKAMSISIIAIIWASARGILGITQGLNEINGIIETRNFVIMRIRSAFFTLILIVGMLSLLVVSVFGSAIMSFLNDIEIVPDFVNSIFSYKGLITVVFSSILFIFLFVALPATKIRIKEQLIGAVFAAIIWWIFSDIFSYYVAHFSTYSSVYGSFAVLIFMGVWLYTGMFIMFIGAQINKCFFVK